MKNKILILSLSLIIVALYGCDSHEHDEHQKSTFLATNPVVKDTFIYKDYVCQINAFQHIELKALEKGYLESIYVDEGKFVKKGQLLFKILPVIYQADYQKALAEVNFVDIEYKNTKALADSNIVSQNELALAKAKLNKAKAELSMAEANLAFTNIYAPFDGIVGRFYDVRKGALVNEGDLLTTLSDNNKMWVYFNVPEAEYLDQKNNIGEKLTMKPLLKMANNQILDGVGVVETMESDFNNETGNIAFRATFQNPSRLLRHGETGNILLPIDLKNVLIIPQKATFEILDKTYVYVINKEGVLENREINIAAEMPHLFAVKSGLNKNDVILVEGLRRVKNQQKINYNLIPFQKLLTELEDIHAE
ncbi:MAG: efflux RND transporter periplasmic adaptor subunit [Alphaproteobacteria bacterium]|nr:efflux RND transporter periplasmic adaptor subunit [Alphaproteobacteria bacterium]